MMTDTSVCKTDDELIALKDAAGDVFRFSKNLVEAAGEGNLTAFPAEDLMTIYDAILGKIHTYPDIPEAAQRLSLFLKNQRLIPV